MVVDPTAPRGFWILGKVLEVYPDTEGFVRSVRLKTNIREKPVIKKNYAVEVSERAVYCKVVLEQFGWWNVETEASNPRTLVEQTE